IPRSKARVVCTLWETMATFVPTSALISVDLPTFGAPIIAMNPQRVCPCPLSSGALSPLFRSDNEAADRRGPLVSAIEMVGFDAGARQHGGGRGLLGGALRAAKPLGRRQVRKLDGNAEFRIVVGTPALDLTIGRSWQPAGLGPFLQHGFRIAKRPHRPAHAFTPQSLDERRGGWISAVDEHRANERLASIRENRNAAAAASVSLSC